MRRTKRKITVPFICFGFQSVRYAMSAETIFNQPFPLSCQDVFSVLATSSSPCSKSLPTFSQFIPTFIKCLAFSHLIQFFALIFQCCSPFLQRSSFCFISLTSLISSFLLHICLFVCLSVCLSVSEIQSSSPSPCPVPLFHLSHQTSFPLLSSCSLYHLSITYIYIC